MKKRTNHYTLMFYPEEKGKSFTLRIHKYTIYSLMLFLVLFLVSLSVLLYKTGEIALKLQLVHSLKEENSHLVNQVEQLRISSEKIEKIENLTAYLYQLSTVSDIDKKKTEKNNLQTDTDIQENSISEFYTEQAQHKSNLNNSLIDAEQFAASIPNSLPVDGWVTRSYFPDSANFEGHRGIDFAAATGTPIRATAVGVVEKVQNDDSYGLIVTVRHDFGFKTKYGHCSQVLVSEMDKVNRGQTIALVGNTGRSTAPHLHYEVLKDGKNVDPAGYIGGHKNAKE
ncbi:MAG: M23 family metallopeptidase [Chitinispirillaceae bacterium]